MREVEKPPLRSDGPLDESESRRVVRRTPGVSDLAWAPVWFVTDAIEAPKR